jgi:beta-1,4-N-acetylglucosaminyltransferase
MRAFVTVGSTQFDTLIDAVLSPEVLATLRDKGYLSIIVQCGKYGGDMLKAMTGNEGSWRMERSGVAVEMWRYKPSLKEEFEAADLVISHAGTDDFRPHSNRIVRK